MKDLFEKIIDQALSRKITDIHILLKKECQILFRDCGDLLKYDTLDNQEGVKLLNYIRFISNIDMNNRLNPQTGNYSYTFKRKTYFLRISSLPGLDVDSIVIRILNNHDSLTLENLSKLDEVNNYLKKIISYDAGLFIVSGPTGSGKSTTLYTLIDSINNVSCKNIVTLEDPIEIYKDYCLQIQLNEKLGINYHSSLKQILRHDPDIIMIGEIRDKETAKLAITCALTGHLVLTTIHANNCINTIKRLLNLEINQIDLEDVLLGVISQRMLFTYNKAVVLSEYITRTEIISYFMTQDPNYTSFKENANHLIERGFTNYEVVSNILEE